jgi:hypothetical protein
MHKIDNKTMRSSTEAWALRPADTHARHRRSSLYPGRAGTALGVAGMAVVGTDVHTALGVE